jgi:hypothetical protein
VSLELALSFIAAGFGALAMFMVAAFWRRLEQGEARFSEVERALNDFRVHVASTYVRAPDLAIAMDGVRRELARFEIHLERIEGKIDGVNRQG